MEFDPKSRVGQMADGWRMERLLGYGGMAAVYQVTDGSIRRALKVLHPRLMQHPIIVQRFQREFDVLATVQHKNALRVFDIGQLETGEPFYTMEFLRGSLMNDIWGEHRGKIPPRQVFQWADELLDVLAEFHKEQILHRDIKPSNIWICEDDTLRLLDFGIARMENAAEALTRDGTALGTPAFMAPEQARGRVHLIDVRSDLFAVGALLYALVSANHLHKAPTPEETLVLAATKPAESVARVMPDLDMAYVNVIDKALSWYPKDRYQTAHEFRSAVQRVLNGFEPDTNAWPTVGAPSGELTVQPIPAAHSPEVQEVVGIEFHDGLGMSEASEFVDTEPINAHIERCFVRIQKALDATRLYGWNHPEVDRRVERAFARVSDTLAHYGDRFEFSVHPDAFRVADQVVWAPDPPHDDVTFNLFTSGFRYIHILPALTLSEFEKFLQLLVLSPTRDLPPEDDLATAFWDLDLTTIRAQLAMVYQVSDDPEEQAVFDQAVGEVRAGVAQSIAKDAQRQIEQLAMLTAIDSSAPAEARAEAVRVAYLKRSQHGALGNQFRGQFTSAVERDDDFSARAHAVLGSAWTDTHSVGDSARLEVTVRLLARRNLDSGLGEFARYLHGTTKQIGDRDAKRSYAEATFGEANAAFAVESIQAEPDLDPRVADFLGKFLAVGDASAMPLVVETIAQVSPVVRSALQGYISRNLAGFEGALAEVVPFADADLATYLLDAAQNSKSEERVQIIGAACSHNSLELRRRAFSLLAEQFPYQAGAFMPALCRDSDDELRIRALQLAANHRFEQLRDVLPSIAQQMRFHMLSFTERRLVLETLFDVDAELGEQICIQVCNAAITATGSGKEGQTTRTMALRLLGERGVSQEAYEAIESAQKWRPSNPKRVREAATHALSQWHSREAR